MPPKGAVRSLAFFLLAGAAVAADPSLAQTTAALADLQQRRGDLGLDARFDFQALGSLRDPLGAVHVRVQQRFLGVPVWGGQAVAHRDAEGQPLPLTDALCRGIDLAVEPSLTPSEALARAQADLAPRGPFAYPPQVRLVIYPRTTRVLRRPGTGAGGDATDWVRQVQGYLLAYHVHAQLENGREETVHADYLLDAHSGAVLEKWDSLHTSAAIGSGVTQYSGTVKLNTTAGPKGFQLRDQTRGRGGTFNHNVVTNLDHSTTGNGALYNDADNTWGDGANYVGALPTTGPTGQTAAADAAYGTQVTWDLYKNVFKRDGIDGTGKGTFSRVHYGTSYDNAFWDDSCFCMTYGDGDTFKSLEAMDVAGHEISHGLCSSSANLIYQGESGGLNEANSDIFGTLAEFYARGGGFAAQSAKIPARGGDWTMGEQLAETPLRYLYKPSKDGFSPDAWSKELGELDTHFGSGPMNRCFYFLSQGAGTRPGDDYTPALPAGMKGLGIDAAARIWYRALTLYLTAASDYAAARTACIRAAKDLHGAGSAGEQAVWNAFHGIKVGPAWKRPSEKTVQVTIQVPEEDVTLLSGASQAFAGSATGGAPGGAFTYAWTFGDGGTAAGAKASHTFTNSGSGPAYFTTTLTATDPRGRHGTATRRIIVLPIASGGSNVLINGGFEQGTTAWEGDTQVIGAFKQQPPHEGTRNAFFGNQGPSRTQELHQTVAIPASATKASLSFQLHIDTEDLPVVPADRFHVRIESPTGALLRELATYSNADAEDGYRLKTFDLLQFKGQAVRIAFQAVEDWLLQTSFVVDQVALDTGAPDPDAGPMANR